MPHSYVSLKYHLIFSTKSCRPWITAELEPELYRYVGAVVRRKYGSLLEIGGTEDHVHLLAELSQTRSVAAILAAVKSTSSSFCKEVGENPGFVWQEGYAAFTVSESQLLRVRRYIRRQKQHHRRVTYADEVRELACRHGLVASPPPRAGAPGLHEDRPLAKAPIAEASGFVPRRCVSLKYHLVFSTKFRLPWITAELEPRLYRYVGEALEKKQATLLEIGGIEDHVHILAEFSQNHSVASVLAAVKSTSSIFCKEEGPNPHFSWQEGYAAFSVSESQIPRVRRYIQRQKVHHRKLTYEGEVRELGRRHGLDLGGSFFPEPKSEA